MGFVWQDTCLTDRDGQGLAGLSVVNRYAETWPVQFTVGLVGMLAMVEDLIRQRNLIFGLDGFVRCDVASVRWGNPMTTRSIIIY